MNAHMSTAFKKFDKLRLSVIHVLLFSLAVQAQASVVDARAGAAAAHFCQTLTSAEIRAFIPQAANARDLSGDEWLPVRELFAQFDCISIPSHRQWFENGRLVIDLEGDGTTRNAHHTRRAIPRRWSLRLDDKDKIVDVKFDSDLAAEAMLKAQSDDERRAIADRWREVLPAAARRIADFSAMSDGERTRAPALFLLEWSRLTGNSEIESYALTALSNLAFARHDASADPLAEAARMAARRTNDCDVIAYADVETVRFDNPANAAVLDEPIASIDSVEQQVRRVLYGLYLRAGFEDRAGDLSRAFRTTDELLELSKRYGSHEGEMYAHHARSQIFGDINEHESAVAEASQVATIAARQMNRSFEARSCNIVGEELIFNRSDPDYDSAIPWLERALRVAPPNNPIITTFQVNLGDALARIGRVEEAEKYLAPALAHARITSYFPRACLFAEHLRRAEGRYDEAIAYARQGITENTGQRLFFTWELQADLGQMLIECGKVDEGIDALRDSVNLIETRRAATTWNPLVRATHFATRQWVYVALLNALVDRKRFDEAFEIAEKMKARALDDLLAGDDVVVTLTAAEREQERVLNERITELNRKVIASKGDAEQEAHNQLRLARATAERFAVETALRGSHAVPHQSPPRDFDPTTHDSPILEYAVLPNSIIAFVVKNGSVHAVRIPATRETIERHVRQLTRSITQRDLRYSAPARALYDTLFAPVATQLAAEKHVTIVPDGVLWKVPFDVLMTRAHEFLITKHVFSYAPSAAMLDAASRRARPAAPRELLAVGDPLVSSSTRDKLASNRDLSLGALPDAAREVRVLSDLYGHDRSTTLVGASAREETFKHLASEYRVVHLATHGIVDDQSPLYSALVLSRADGDDDDGLLEMREVRKLDMNADLVILSACDTARGALYPGEGVIGLSWAFLTAGCPTTVVSQWKADSRTTSRLMIEFHRRLLRGGRAADALREAKLSLLREREHDHPFYWCPFIVVGSDAKRQ